jgi:hypothetical protein
VKSRYVLLCTVLMAGCRLGESTGPRAPTTPTTPARSEPSVRIGLKVDTAAVVLSTESWPRWRLMRTGRLRPPAKR